VDLPKSIGIKLFDDTFVPVLKSDEQKSRKLSLTTIEDNQTKAVVSLYEGSSDKCKNNTFLGKLVIPINRDTGKGEPAIEVHLRNDESGILFAKAWDADSHEECSIEIKHSAGSKRIYPETLSDIEIENLKGTENYHEDNSEFEGYSDDRSSNDLKKNIVILVAIVVVIVILGFLSFLGASFIYKNFIKDKLGKKTEKVVEPPKSSSSSSISSSFKLSSSSSSISSVSSSSSSSKSSVSSKVAGIKQMDGAKHFVRKGDNLWNICKKYYGDAWYYPSLYQANPSLKSPRLIKAGTTLIIPDKTKLRRWDPKRNKLAD